MFCVEYFHGISTHSEISCMFHVPISTIPIVSWNLEWEWDRQSFERKLECDTHTSLTSVFTLSNSLLLCSKMAHNRVRHC